jgi:hypothetical protein
MTANGAKVFWSISWSYFFTFLHDCSFCTVWSRNPTLQHRFHPWTFYAELNQAFTAFGVPERRVVFFYNSCQPCNLWWNFSRHYPQLTAALTPRFGPAAGLLQNNLQIRPASDFCWFIDVEQLKRFEVLSIKARFTPLDYSRTSGRCCWTTIC